MKTREKILWGTQVLTAIALIAIARHYRVFSKARRVLLEEKRIPGMVKDHRMNRYYDSARDLFQRYDIQRSRAVIVGDSHVSGVSWPELMPDAGIVGRGIPGDTVSGVTHRLIDFAKIDLEWLGVLIGTNDVLRGGDRVAILDSLKALASEIESTLPDVMVRWVSIPPFSSWVEHSERRNRVVRELNRGLRDLVAERGWLWIDLHTRVVDEKGYLSPRMTTDGVHLSSTAYGVFADLISK